MKEPLIVIQTEDKPWVILDSVNKVFEIGGKSLPDDSTEFYAPVLEWISEYIKKPNKSTHLICKFDYFNSSSARSLYQIFKVLEKIEQSDNEIKIIWYHDPGDKLMENKGNEFKTVLKFPFVLLSKEAYSK